jgi:serpin B
MNGAHRRIRTSTAAIGVVVGLIAASCGPSSGGEVARADVPRAPTEGTSSAVAVAAVNGLAADLYRQLAIDDANLVLSPYSVEVALAMARNGARGETRTQMDAVLRAGPGAELDAAFNVLDALLAGRSGHRGDDVRNGDIELATANAVYGQRDTTFETLFLETLARYYGAGVRLVDFKGAAEAARREINEWVADQTKDRIVDLLPDGSLDALTRMVLTNAIYFKAPWAKKFHPADSQPFTRVDGSVVSAPAMATTKIGTYGEGPGWRAASIPYLGNELSMVVIVPDDVTAFESSLDGDELGAILQATQQQLATLQMPKFGFRTEAALKPLLSALGMPLAFADDADFSGITTEERLRIDDVFHQAFIAVDEEGTEAAAATAVVFEAVSGPVGPSLVVDRPFLFAIRDDTTNAVLFLGRVMDPTVA